MRAIALAALMAAVGSAPDHAVGQDPGIDGIFQDLAAPGTPGCAVGVVRDGALVFSGGYGTAVVVLCNRSDADPGRRAMAVAEQVLGDRMAAAAPRPLGVPAPAEPGAPDPALLAVDRLRSFEGRYYAPELEVHYAVRATPDGLAVTGGAGQTVHLRPVEDDTFRGNGLTLQFRVEDQVATGFVVDAGRVTGVVFERAPEPGGWRP